MHAFKVLYPEAGTFHLQSALELGSSDKEITSVEEKAFWTREEAKVVFKWSGKDVL